MDKRHVGRDAMILTSSKVLANVFSMISAMLLARVRTLSENGTYAQLTIIITLASSVIMLGLPNSINYFLAKQNTIEEKRKFLSVFYTAATILSVVMGIVLTIMIPFWKGYFDNPEIENFAFFLLIFPWTQVISSTVENVLIVLGKIESLILYRISNSAVLVLIILIVWLVGADFRTYMIAYVAFSGVYALLVYILVNGYIGGLKAILDAPLLKSIFAFSLPLGLASIVGTLNIELDKLMIGHFFTTDQMAIYANASKEMPVTIIATSITAVLMPQMVRLFGEKRNKDAVELWKSATIISMAIISFLSIGLAFFSREAMIVLYSEKYASGWPIFCVYSLGLILKVTYFGMVLNTTGHTKKILYSSIGPLILNFIFNFAFYYMFGWVGPAIGTVLANICMNVYQLIHSSKVISIEFIDIFPWKESAGLIILNVIMGIGFKVLHYKVFPGVWSAIALAFVWGLVYFFIVGRTILKHWRIINT